ncbi:hypothetical protein IWQ60_009875, partial [Tieghemiomyces parasiticus]
DTPVGVQAAGQDHGGHVPDILAEGDRILGDSDSVKVGNRKYEAAAVGTGGTVVDALLQPDPVANRAKIIAQVRAARRLDTGENSLRGAGVGD